MLSISAIRKLLKPKSFRGKFILTVGTVVLASLLFSGGFALRNVHRLASDATLEIQKGLTRATTEYLTNYVDTTSLRVDSLINGTHSEVTTLADAMQSLIDRPQAAVAVGGALASDTQFNPALQYDVHGHWAQNRSGAPSVLSVWGYLLGADKKPRPEVQKLIRDTAVFDFLSTSLMAGGSQKLQVYYVGPKDQPIMRTTPYADQAQMFDKLYPGHNDANFWQFFYPGVYEGWQRWIKDPQSAPVQSDKVTETAPYVDAITGKLIVSYFHPLWTKDRKDVAGMTAADVTLEQLAGVVESVKVADTGFAFLASESGNVMAVRPEGEKTLGLQTANAGAGQGVTGVDRTLIKSNQAAIRTLKIPSGNETDIAHINLVHNGAKVPYLVAMRRLGKRNLWDGKIIVGSQLVIGFMVPESEVYASLFAARRSVDNTLQQIVRGQAISVVLSLLALLGVILAISKPISAGLNELAVAARRLKDKDYSVRIEKPSDDEVGEVGLAFNSMATDIRYHTENLEHLVSERTKELETAADTILLLNARLNEENVRLGSEVDVARRMQMMVLPKRIELDAVKQLDIAAFMEPADEVGGDYYDVLQAGNYVKVGIGDVTGHGLESGVLMLMVQSVARALEERGATDPEMFLSVLNRVIYKNIERTESNKSLTLAFADFRDNGEVMLSGQHEEVLIVRNNGTIERIDTNDLGFPIGLEADISPFVAVHTLTLAPNDVMILHTDGVTEAENPLGQLYGMERLCESAQRHSEKDATAIKNGIISDLMQFIDNQKIHDDITIVVLKQR